MSKLLCKNPVSEVFAIDLLRERILDYVIHDKEKVILQNVTRCRFVSKAWLSSVSRILLVNQKPLLHLILTDVEYEINPTLKKNKLKEFMTDVTAVSSFSGRTTPWAISTFLYLYPENLKRFSKCLACCGMGLTEFYLIICYNVAPTPLNFSRIMLPNLRHFSVHFQGFSSSSDPFAVPNKTSLIQSVFDVSNNLASLAIAGDMFGNGDPSGFINLVLPPSITNLCLTTAVNLKNLQVLVTCSLPHLKKLNIILCDTEPSALRFIMKEMKHLHQLRLVLKIKNPNELPWPNASDILDSAFIGFRTESIEALRQNPRLWEDNGLRLDYSIREMTDLHTLELDCNFGGHTSLISDMTFYFAFSKMPKLKKLILKGNCVATKEMEIKWQQDGRIIDNHCHPHFWMWNMYYKSRLFNGNQ